MVRRSSRFATASWRFVALHDLATGRELWHAYKLEPFVRALAFRADGGRLAVGGDGGGVSILDTDNGEVRRTLDSPLAGPIGSLAWLPDGESILVVTQAGSLHCTFKYVC